MMIVYGELLIIENIIIGAVLLSITGRICGRNSPENSNRLSAILRLAAASIMCGLFSLMIFLNIKVPVKIITEILFALAVCTVAFGKDRRHENIGTSGIRSFSAASVSRMLSIVPWRRALVFIIVTYFMGGITMGLLFLTEHQGIYTAVGIYTGDMKAAMLAFFIWLGYMSMLQIIRTVKREKFYTEHSYEVCIVCMGRSIKAKAFLDTGNRLREPVSGKSAAIASESLWQRMQNCGLLHEERFSLVPYETVGSSGVLQAVRTDYIDIGEKRIKGSFVAKSDGCFSIGKVIKTDNMQESADYELLIPAEMTDK